MRVLITGASGFTGRALVQHLVLLGEQDLYGLVHRSQIIPLKDLKVTFVKGDLLDTKRLRQILTEIHPDCIVHLAGLNHGNLQEMLITNAVGTQNLLDIAHAENTNCRILVVSSSAVYGYAGNNPIPETAPVNPRSAYGISKAAQEHVARMAYVTRGIRIVIARPFNLVGPGQSPYFVTRRIVDQIACIETGKQDTISLLEINSKRDFVDIRDAVRAYTALVMHPDFDLNCAGKIFNVGSANAYSISYVIRLIEESTGASYRITLPDIRPAIVIPSQQSDSTLIEKITGWVPHIPLKKSLYDMLTEARKTRTRRD